MKLSIRCQIALALLFGLCACGQSGPLYIPGNPSEVQEPPPTPSSQNEEEDEKREND